MRSEIFRMERVTYHENGVKRLDDLDLHIFSGEILGLLPLNSYGLTSLLDVITGNLPLQYGFVFYREKLINSWRHPRPQHNHIGLIRNQSQLVEGMSLADNVFVLRSGFRAWYIRSRLLESQLRPFFDKVGIDIPPDAYPEDLSPFQRIVVELIRAMVAGYRLIVLYDISTLLSEGELRQLRRIIRQCAGEGISFFCIGFQPEALTAICNRICLFSNGRILHTVDTPDALFDILAHTTGVKPRYEDIAVSEAGRCAVLQARRLSIDGAAELSFSVYPGECVMLQDAHNRITDAFVDILTGSHTPVAGELLLCGKPLPHRENRNIAIIQELPSQSMLFPELSYFDNLFLCSDHHLPQLWLRSRMQRRLAKEYAQRKDADLFRRSIESLTEQEKYDLVYNRIMLQKPKVVICIRPFKGADMELREHIRHLFAQLRKKQIAVIMMTVNASDALAVADRVIPV